MERKKKRRRKECFFVNTVLHRITSHEYYNGETLRMEH